MEQTEQKQQLKQVQFIFWLNLALALFSFSIFIKSLNSDISWKMICSGAGFVLLLGLTTALFFRMMKLRKTVKD
ncbi:hypothetical protein [Mucilaginibacter ginsenosidivorans]|uniref:Uncharacterized protein n=1 Tax=Mucilaginibacter ginsenosidivorans TaxID=398053 RepID=A0A5B8UQW9_9SPHI|nr:hypothetical protein [Mucilaginibacter ginsenosidivorans]QEC61497.1 hypothetical protein FRZ54_02495 [Mucilaginibacter ginsenosidivorans]